MSHDLSTRPAAPLPGTQAQPSSQAQPARSRLRPPSEREFNVYKRCKIWRHLQWEVAADMKVHYSRVSQIVKKVERWLAAGGSPTDPAIRDHAARQRLSRATHKLRLVRAIELATLAMEEEVKPFRITKRRLMHGSEIWREETTRDQPTVNLPAIRVLVSATKALYSVDAEDANGDAPEPLPEHDLLPAIFDLLCRWRARAETDGRLQTSSEINALVAGALNGLLGTSLPAAPDPAIPKGESTVHEPLNVSAEPAEAVAATDDVEMPCAESKNECAEKSAECERPVGGAEPTTNQSPVGCTPPTAASENMVGKAHPTQSEQLVNHRSSTDGGDGRPNSSIDRLQEPLKLSVGDFATVAESKAYDLRPRKDFKT